MIFSPINIKVINKISGNICYEVDITESMWVQSHGLIDQCYVLITDKIVTEIIKYDDLHPEIILFEHYHIKSEDYNELEINLKNKGYTNIKGERLNSIAIKNK